MSGTFTFSLGQPIDVAGQRVILVADIVGPVPVAEQHEYVEVAKASQFCNSIQIGEGDIEQAREQYPDLPVYGLWQTLICSGLVDDTALQVVPSHGRDGYYIHVDAGRVVYSGIYQAGFFAQNTAFSLSHARVIQPDLSQLKRPAQQAFLASELLQARRHLYRQSFLRYGAMIVALLVAFAVLDSGLQWVSEQRHEIVLDKDRQLKRLQQEVKTLAQHRVISRPDQSRQLERLAVLLHDFDEVRFEKAVTLDSGYAEVSFESSIDPSIQYSFLSVQPGPDGRWHGRLQL